MHDRRLPDRARRLAAIAVVLLSCAAAPSVSSAELPVAAGGPGRVVFESGRDGDRGIHLLEFGAVRPVLLDRDLDGYDPSAPGFANPSVGDPELSPDGLSVAATVRHGSSTRLLVIDLATGRTLDEFGDGHARGAAWSPDGSRIAYADTRGLVVRSLVDRTSTPLHARGFEPAWSPDGVRIAALDSTPSGSILVVHSAATGDRLASFSLGGTANDLTWSPDGAAFAWTRHGPGCSSQLVVVGADGRGMRTVPPATCSYVGVDWTLDGILTAPFGPAGTGSIVAVDPATGTARPITSPQTGVADGQPSGTLAPVLAERS